jgi:hypothetical protein
MKKTIISLGAITVLMAFIFFGSASAATINLDGGTTISLGQSNVVISGTCTGSTLSVPLVLSQNGVQTQVGMATTPDNGNANTFVGFASFGLNMTNFSTGAATLTAVCPEGNATVGINLINPTPSNTVPIGTSLNFNGNANLGGNLGVSGVCGTNPSGSNVSFTLTQNGTTMNLGSTTTTGNDGNFSSNVNFGSSIVAGPATITATCPGTGNVITSSVNIIDPNANNTGTGGASGGDNSSNAGGAAAGSNTSGGGAVSGTSTTPTGGVAAGGSGISIVSWLALVLVVLGALGFVSAHRKELSLE